MPPDMKSADLSLPWLFSPSKFLILLVTMVLMSFFVAISDFEKRSLTVCLQQGGITRLLWGVHKYIYISTFLLVSLHWTCVWVIWNHLIHYFSLFKHSRSAWDYLICHIFFVIQCKSQNFGWWLEIFFSTFWRNCMQQFQVVSTPLF